MDDAVDCKSVLEFQRLLNKLRSAEDKIIFKLNCDLPTHSFADKKKVKSVCDEIEQKLSKLRQQRHDLIYRCAKENQAVVNDFKNEESKMNDLKNAHYNLRMLKNENEVEEIVIRQTDKVVHERCRKEML